MAASLALYRARSLRWRRIRLVILLAGLIAADAAAAEGERRLFAMGTAPRGHRAVGSLVGAGGLREGGRRPGAAELGEARRAGDFGRLALTGRSATRLAAGLILEEGGFAKGVGLDAALEAARGPGVGRAVVGLGGQLAVVGGALELDLVAPPGRPRR